MFASSVMAPISKLQARLLLAGMLFWSATLWAQTSDEAIALLEEMAQAVHQLSYVGTFVYQQGDQLQTMRIIRSVSDAGEVERLVAISGQTREVIRASDRVTCILPEDSSIVVEQASTPRPFTAIPIERLDFLGKHYQIQLADSDRIAGMIARQVNILPRDGYRYGQRLWLDEHSKLPLRSEVFDEQGEIVEKLFFTSLEIRDSIPEEMLLPSSVGDHDQLLELERQLPPRRGISGGAPAAWQSDDLPTGFRQKVQRRHFLPNKFYQVEHHVYSDGLASVSVFVEQLDEGDLPLTGPSRIGGVNVYGHLHNGHLITVLGEVPEITVRQIARSMTPVNSP